MRDRCRKVIGEITRKLRSRNADSMVEIMVSLVILSLAVLLMGSCTRLASGLIREAKTIDSRQSTVETAIQNTMDDIRKKISLKQEMPAGVKREEKELSFSPEGGGKIRFSVSEITAPITAGSSGNEQTTTYYLYGPVQNP